MNNETLNKLIADLIEYAANPGYSHGDYADTMRQAAAALAEKTIPPAHLMMETIKQAADESGFTRSASCCTDPLKFCNGDEWQGNIEGFAKALLRLAERTTSPVSQMTDIPPPPEMETLADMERLLSPPADWDADYTSIWQKLQVAERNKMQWRTYALGLHAILTKTAAAPHAQVVPREPTEEMIRMGNLQREVGGNFVDVWRSMWDASASAAPASKPYPTRPDCEAEAMTPAMVDHMKMARFSELVEDWPSWEEDIRAWQAAQTQPLPQPSFDQAEFDAMVEKGTKAWAGVPAPRQEPEPAAEGELPPLPSALMQCHPLARFSESQMHDYARAHETHLMQSYAPLMDAASAKHRIEKLEATIAEWEKLKDPIVLRANLLRGFPARLTTEQLVHIAGDEVQRAVAASQQAAEPRACQHDFRHFSGTLFRRCIRCDDIETPCTNSIAAPAIQQPQWKPPRTADELIAFIGSHCASMDTDGPVDDRMIRLSFHDLRSAFNFAGAYEAIQQPQDDHSEPDNPLFLALAKKGGA